MVDVRFVNLDGSRVTVQADPGARLLDVAQAAGMPLEGTCEGQMACSTCHVIISPDWFDKLPLPTEDEEDLLDLAAGVTRTSRLSCQVQLTEELSGIAIKIPGVVRDLQIG